MKILQYNFLDPGIRSFCLTVSFVITVLIGRAEAQTLLTESFNYPSGTLLTNAHWSQQAGGSPSVTVANGNLTYPNTISNNIGSKVSLSSSGQDVYHSFTSASLDVSNPGVYSSLIVNVSQAQAIGDFFFALGASGPNASVYIRSNGIGFSFGVGKTAASAEYETTVRPFNTNIMLVLKYEFVTGAQNDEIKLYVNPSLASEPVTADIVTAPAIGDVGLLTYAFLYQGNASNAPTLEVDGINVGRSWASVTSAIFDYGDTPTLYDFTKDGVYVPAAHTVLTGLSLGSLLPSTELTPHSVADGADNNGTNGDGLEEDAIDVSLNQIRKGVSYVLSVPVTNPSGTKYLYGWIDFNNDGKFQAEEFASISFSTSGSSTQTLTWTAVQTATIASGANKLYMRLRLSDRSLNDFTTVATGGATLDERSIGSGATSTNDPTDYVTPANGEVEDYQIEVVNTYEYGDLPASFENDKDSNPLPGMHAPLTGFTLGSLIDFESNPASVTSPNENNIAGDNAVGLADEDALTSLMSVNRGAPYSLSVPISIPSSLSGWKYLYGWLDLNGDGRFQAGEIATNNTTGNTSTNLTLTWTTAQTNQIASGTTKIYLRLRLSNLDLQDFTTVATGGATLDERSIGNGATTTANSVNAAATPFGEIEDYQLPVDLYDFGDVPISYDNDKDGNFVPAGHISLAGLSLGNIVPGVELTPHSVAVGADNNGANGDGLEEDAIDVSLNQIRKGVSYVLSVPVVNTSGTKYLYGWIDFNNDGKFQVEEVATTSFGTAGSSTQTLTWPTAQTSTIVNGATQLYMRLRLSDRFLNDFTTVATGGAILDERSIGNGATSTGDATNHVNPTNGEVEDYQIEVVDTYEYGDAPASFENDKDNNLLPAAHAPLTGFTLGSLIDFESTPASVTSPNENNTTGDNAVGSADEDALQPSIVSISRGMASSISVPISIPSSLTGTKYLYGWIDLNNDGRFQVEEVATTSTSLATNTNLTLTWSAAQTAQIPSGVNTIYLRLRLSNQNLQDFTTVASGGATLDERSIGNGATSSANSANAATTPFGEVEDYQLPVDLYDFGDVPNTYATSASGFLPARQVANDLLRIGATVDIEPTAHSVAQDADNNGINGDGLDEDGIDPSSFSITPNTAFALPVTVTNSIGSGATLYGWIDFNNDGKFQAAEYSSVNVPNGTNGMVTLNWTAAQTASTGSSPNVYMRLRLANNALSNSASTNDGDTRSFADGLSSGNYTATTQNFGEVEDYRLATNTAYDFGDVPVSYDQPTGALYAARHLPSSTFYLGATIPDTEFGPQSVAPNADNNGTNGDGLDEDGIDPTAPPVSPTIAFTLPVTVNNTSGASGTLYGWLDANDNGIFEIGERISVPVPTNTTSVNLSWPESVTSLIVHPHVYLRLRLAGTNLTDNGITPYDEASIADGSISGTFAIPSIGEVEDYRLAVENPVFDFGDAPDDYELNSQHNYVPARHKPESTLFLGNAFDTEVSKIAVQPGEDNGGTNGDGADEDGITGTLPELGPTTTTYSVNVNVNKTIAGTATLHAWIDMDGNGRFSPFEYTSTTITGTSGLQTVPLTWTSPFYFNTGVNRTYMRLRLTTATLTDNTSTLDIDERSIGDGLNTGNYGTIYANGEIEDYPVPLPDPTTVIVDSDGDGIPDDLDLDSDNDGILDTVESSLSLNDTAFKIYNTPNYINATAIKWVLYVTGDVGTSVTYAPYNGTPTTQSIPASGILEITLMGNQVPDNTINQVTTGKYVELNSSGPISILQEIYGTTATAQDIAVVYPSSLRGRKYTVSSYNVGATPANGVQIFSTSDGNNVEVKNKAGVTVATFALNGGQNYIYENGSTDLTGYSVVSSKDVGVMVYTKCANGTSGACDNLLEYLLPDKLLGTKFLTRSAGNTGRMSIVATKKNTVVEIDGAIMAVLADPGDSYVYTQAIGSSQIIETNIPVQIVKVIPYNDDPSITTIQDINKATLGPAILTIPSTMIYANYLTIFVKTANTGSMLFNGNPITTWQPFSHDASYSFATLTNTSGIVPGARVEISSTTGTIPFLTDWYGTGPSVSDATPLSIGGYNLDTGNPSLTILKDSDSDGIPDYLDLDSDNDGCLDALEGSDNVTSAMLVSAQGDVRVGTGSSASNQNLCASATCVDAQGVPLIVNPGGAADADGLQGQGLGSSINSSVQDAICLVTPVLDSDGDGIPDDIDLDDDNDGIPDCTESGFNGTPTSSFKINYDANVPTDHLAGPAFQIQITPPSTNKEGNAWTYGKIDFSKNFSFTMQVYLGANAGGADGLAVVFQNSPNGYNAIGSNGAGLGAQGIANGIALEIDTFMNPGDPGYDHGTIRTSSDWTALSGDGPLKPSQATVKDGMWHEVTVNWSTVTNTLAYTFDGNPVAAHTFPTSGSNSIIGILGSTQAYFGYTGSTGGATNDQRIGFDNPCLLPVFLDTDNDGIFDHLDLDSDNDGCLDALEGGDNVTTAMLVNSGGTVVVGAGSPASNQNLCASATCVDAQGVPLVVNPGGAADTDGLQGQGLGSSVNSSIQDATCLVIPFVDSDGDGIPDDLDMDDDNDGIPDCTESGFNGDPAFSFKINYNSNVPTDHMAGPAFQIQITPPANNQEGNAWTYGKIDFSKNFSFTMQVYLGANAGGADGLAVVFQNSPSSYNAIGSNGGGLGAQGIANGIALELDTFMNPGDPGYDHGTIRTSSNWTALSADGSLKPNQTTAKDGMWHEVTVNWSAVTNTLAYTFDGNPVAAHTFPASGSNSIMDILGSTQAYFGYTGSTGGLFNDQRIGFDNPCLLPVFRDTDNDGIFDHLDLDSDNDGCLDALEGGDNVAIAMLVNSAGTVEAGTGSSASNQNLCATAACIDAQGVPLMVNPGGAADVDGLQGQGLGSSIDSLIQDALCLVTPFCYKPGATTGGITLDTKLGITSLGRAGADQSDNWPMVRKGGWIALEAKAKGFVLNRVKFNTSNQPVADDGTTLIITTPVEGMMIYDTTNQCLKMYTSTDGGTTFAWHCMETQTCPD
ncbi:lectin-like domain-containing protein [Chryseobacterium potabilaquae]|uniref:Pesticidal crystal protein Cry22Aa n=1 Tax=Chryseobacterium potabilaquae TaxID=2675057 RepID=A0A6N4X7K7_9FLAO|nr:GEVED domain-containing protein [Chryseobacterium potabilaquae]CAA7194925.1 Pesticidal crystal protein Cry22Aa [Chryseobacterium potabilaquae]